MTLRISDCGRGLEHAAGTVDVDSGHQRLVGHRVDDRREVKQHVGAGQHRGQVAAGDVDKADFDTSHATAAARAHRGL